MKAILEHNHELGVARAESARARLAAVEAELARQRDEATAAVQRQLDAVGRGTADQNAQTAPLFGSFYAAMARRAGRLN